MLDQPNELSLTTLNARGSSQHEVAVAAREFTVLRLSHNASGCAAEESAGTDHRGHADSRTMLARYLRLAGHAVHEADKVHLRWSVRARYMCPRPVVVLGVLSQNSREMPLSK